MGHARRVGREAVSVGASSRFSTVTARRPISHGGRAEGRWDGQPVTVANGVSQSDSGE